jgi:hypothetical protein
MISLAPGGASRSLPNDPCAASPASSRLYAVNLAAAVAVVLCLPLVAYTRLMLYAFYVRGSFLLDTGLFADLLWHSDLALTQPASIGGGSYFAVHATPLFLPLSLLSRLLPLTMPQFFSVFIAASQTLLAFAVFWMVVAADARRRTATPWLAALAGLGFAFSGLAIDIVRYPHFETLIAAFFLLFITALATGRFWLAVGFFICGLLVREDAGLHYLAVLGLIIALDAARGVRLHAQRTMLGFAVAGLLYAVTAMIAQRIAFPAHISSFAAVYLGDPPLAQLTVATLLHRMAYFAVNRPYILLPACAVGIWAKLAREPFVAIGFLACLPWLGLQLLAASPFAAAVASYYAFPCLIGMAWPLVAPLFNRVGTMGQTQRLLGFAAVVLLSFLPGHDLHDPGRLPVAAAFLHPAPSAVQQADIDRAVEAIGAARPSLGRLMADNSVVALNPEAFGRTEIDTTPGMGHDGATMADTVVFFTDGYDAPRLRALAAAAGLTRRYRVAGTPLHLATHLDVLDIPGLRGSIVPE